MKNSIELILCHLETNSKIRMDNLTSWMSSYLMLESFLKAYHRSAFSAEVP